MSDYIPFGDPQFNLWQKNLMNIIREKLTQWGIEAVSKVRQPLFYSLGNTILSFSGCRQPVYYLPQGDDFFEFSQGYVLSGLYLGLRYDRLSA